MVKMSRCNQGGITDAAFTHLTGIHLLDIRACTQDAITGATFAHLRGVRWLLIDGHRNDLRVITAHLGLPYLSLTSQDDGKAHPEWSVLPRSCKPPICAPSAPSHVPYLAAGKRKRKARQTYDAHFFSAFSIPLVHFKLNT